MRTLFLFIIILSISNLTYSQKFWLITNSFPSGYKNDIEQIADSVILVSTDNELSLSFDQGKNWNQSLYASRINTIYHSANGRLFLGGAGKIFYTDDLLSWDSIPLPTGHQVLQFAEHNSAIYLITGGFNNVQGYVGDGVFKSNNNGLSWERKNNGLGFILSAQFIKVDKYDRLIVAFADNNISQQSGLYISSNNADSWQRIVVKVDGKNAISSDALKIEDFTNLSITNNDSIVISFDGIADNVGVRLNLTKHIDDLLLDNFWNRIKVFNSNMWWMDRSMGPLHISQSGDWYSSLYGSINTGGSLFSKTNGTTWLRHQYGLGVDYNGMFNTQKFIELRNGKIFMIQYGDERVYTTDTSLTTNVDDIHVTNNKVYPNPISNGETLQIDFVDTKSKTIEIYNMNSQLINKIETTEKVVKYIFKKAGLYVIYINEGNKAYYKKVIVNK